MRTSLLLLPALFVGCSTPRPPCLTSDQYFPDGSAASQLVDGGVMVNVTWQAVPEVPAAFYATPTVTGSPGSTGARLVAASGTGVQVFTPDALGTNFDVVFDEQFAGCNGTNATYVISISTLAPSDGGVSTQKVSAERHVGPL